jgi:methanogenic corrinoid protein MtbC1
MPEIQDIVHAVENGKSKLVGSLVEAALAGGLEPFVILNEGLIGAMTLVGDGFQRGERFIPEMLMAARTMKKGLEVLKPFFSGTANISLGKCIIGTVQGDLHDIGKNLVALMIESVGFEVIDLGVDVSAETFVKTLKANPDTRIVALSCLLTTTMPSMREIAGAVKAAGPGGFKLIVGGAPITQEYADEIGADGYSPDAAAAAALATTLVKMARA